MPTRRPPADRRDPRRLTIEWRPAGSAPPLVAGDVHLWRARLDRDGSRPHVLSDDEQRRARRFQSTEDRRRYVAAHTFLRSALAAYLDRSPADLQFVRGPGGKPQLSDRALEFSMSRTPSTALVGVRPGGPIGVDVELLTSAAPRPTGRLLTQEEQAALGPQPGAEQLLAVWVLKEALGKGLGVGLDLPWRGVTVLDADGQPAPTVVPAPFADDAWSLRLFRPVPNGLGALAVRGSLAEVIGLDWSPGATG